MSSLFHDFRGQVSWGRVCALVALVVAVIGQFYGMDAEHLKLWLSVATGNYAASKITEMICGNKVGLAGPSAPGSPLGVVPSTIKAASDGGNS